MLGIRGNPAVAVAALVAIVVLGVLLIWAPSDASAQGTPTVRVELERPTVNVGEEFDIFVYIEGARRLGGFQFTLTFDETYVQYVSSEVTEWLGSTGREVTVLGPVEGPGSLFLGAASLGAASQPGPDGDADLATVRFLAMAEGQTELDLSEVLLVDTNNQQSAVEGENGLLVIGGGGTPGPTETVPATANTPGPTAATGTPTSTPETTVVPGGHDVFLPANYRNE